MSEITQDELREQLIIEQTNWEYENEVTVTCGACLGSWPLLVPIDWDALREHGINLEYDPMPDRPVSEEQHRTGCPCDQKNVTVSREDLQFLAHVAELGDRAYPEHYCRVNSIIVHALGGGSSE